MNAAGWFLHRRYIPWQGLRAKLASGCDRSDCARGRTFWGRLFGEPRGVRMQGAWYCLDPCIEHALTDALERMRPAAKRMMAHRVPLGLLLLSRQQLTAAQLRTALEAQRVAGRGKIGEWLQSFGFVSDAEITAALARQWSCPVLQAKVFPADTSRTPQLPVALLESFGMAPVNYVSSTATLHMAFSERIDYTVLYAIEQMLECHTEPCLVSHSVLRQSLAARAEECFESEVVIERVGHAAEVARIVCGYAACIEASEIRLAGCGTHLWVRVLAAARQPLDLLLRSTETSDGVHTNLVPMSSSASAGILPA